MHMLDNYAIVPPPRAVREVALYEKFRSVGLAAGMFTEPGEAVADYLVDLELAKIVPGGLQITSYGRALLGDDWHEPEPDAITVLTAGDPMALAAVTSAVGRARTGLLFDPHFKHDMLSWLANSTLIERVLVKRPTRSDELKAQEQLLPIFLGGVLEATPGRQIEVRVSSDSALHDRGTIAQDGTVTLLGTSLTGVGRHLSVVVPLPELASRPFAEQVESMWKQATPVEPMTALRTELPATHAGDGVEGPSAT